MGLTKARELVEQDHVNILIGPVSSGVALAIRQYLAQNNVPWVATTAATKKLTAPGEVTPNVYRTIDDTDQGSYPLGKWAYDQGYRKVAVIATDFQAGHDSADAFMAAFKAQGGSIVKDVYPSLGATDYIPFLSQAQSANPDAIFGWIGGETAIQFTKQYKNLGLNAPLFGCNVLTDDSILQQEGNNAVGIVTTGAYSAAVNNSTNKAFVSAYNKQYNGNPTRYSESAYSAGQIIVQAVKDLNGDLSNPQSVYQAIGKAGSEITAPTGNPVEFDQYHQLIANEYVMKVEKKNGTYWNSVVNTIPNVFQSQVWGWWHNK